MTTDPVQELHQYVESTVARSDGLKPCILCGHNRDAGLLVKHDGLDNGNHADFILRSILKCSNCGLVYFNDHMTLEEQVEMYGKIGKIMNWESSEQYSGLGDEMAMIRDKATIIRNLFKNLSGARLLDVGCGEGALLTLLRSAQCDLYGVDISEALVNKGITKHGLKLTAGTLEQVRYPDEYFDYVTAFDIVEHLLNPIETMIEINRVLKMGGEIAVEIPNEATSFRKVARLLYYLSRGSITWPLQKLYSFVHLYYFTPKTLRYLLTRSGFSVLDLSTKEAYSLKYRRDAFNPVMRMATNSLLAVDRLFGTNAKLVVHAKKVQAAAPNS